jgi:MFS family permease
MKPPSQFALFAQRRFAPFFWTQFLGALNDNVFKVAILTAITYDSLRWTSVDAGLLNNLIPGLFILPFVLFSAVAGQLADRSEKSGWMRQVKLAEIALMSIAAIGWLTHQLWLLVIVIAAMGLQSTFFGPVKYAYLPQHLNQDELTGGNGVVEMGTFVGILLGQVLGAVLVMAQPWGVVLAAGSGVTLALLGWLTSRAIPPSPAAEPALQVNWNPFSATWSNLQGVRRNHSVWWAIIANSWFWFYGAIMLAQFPVYARDLLQGDSTVFVLLLMVFSLGVGGGSLLCEWLSGRRIEIGLVPLGAIGMTAFGIDLWLASSAYVAIGAADWTAFIASTGSTRIMLDCLLIGLFGGIYSVPLFAMIQTRCHPQQVSRTIGGLNTVNSLFMVVAALLGMVLLQSGFTIPEIFLVTALLNALVTLYIFVRVPEFLARFLAWLPIRRTRAADAD